MGVFMRRQYKHLTYEDRIKIEALRRCKIPPRVIAEEINCHVSTIYRELKRGQYDRLTSELIKVRAYSADIAQKFHDYQSSNKGAPLKIGNDYAFAEYVEDKILNFHYSPDAVIGELARKGPEFSTRICTKTLYNYIERHLFLHLSNEHLLRKRDRRVRFYRPIRRIKRPLCRSIEERPISANNRQEFGHWEMDTVYGSKAGQKTALLVLTERKTRFEIVRRMKDRTQKEVQRILNRLERQLGSVKFRRQFKSITVDNGSEFLNPDLLEQSCLTKQRRTVVFFCHPYSSWERGSNENANSLIRRFIPKGTDIGKYSADEIAEIESWINSYPRKILDYSCSLDEVRKVEKIGN